MATIELQQVEKKFGELHAVKPMDLTIQDGEFVVLLGPSGCEDNHAAHDLWIRNGHQWNHHAW
jgi:ABC-type iron transport system FetAB ATPase subunit